jgi:hypothetical protein
VPYTLIEIITIATNLLWECVFTPMIGVTTLFSCMVVFHCIFSIWHGSPLSYLHGRNLESKKKLMPIRMMNSAGMNNINIVNNIDISSDNVVLNSIFSHYYHNEQCFIWSERGWTIICVNSARSITPLKFTSVSLNVWILNGCSYFVWETHII